MARKLFPPQDAPADAAPLPAGVADSAVVTLEIPELSSAEWAAHRKTIETRIAATEDKLAQIRDALEIAEIASLLNRPNAEQLVAELREDARLADIELESLKGVLTRADDERGKAVVRETAAERQKRIETARAAVQRRMPHTAKFDALLRAVEVEAVELDRSARMLSAYTDVSGVSLGRMNSETMFQRALFAPAPTLAKLLGLDRDQPLTKMEPLATIEARFWHLPVPAGDTETAGEARVALDDPALGQFGGRARDTIRAGDHVYQVGEHIPADVLLKWKLPNRRAMVENGKLEVFASARAADRELEAAVMGEPAK